MNLKSITIIIALLFCIAASKAQPFYWDTQGNTDVSAGPAILGSLVADGYDLDFYTNNAAKMRLKSGGNLGIGTTSPSNPLHLHNSSNVFQMTNGSTGTGSGDGFQISLSTNDDLIKNLKNGGDMSFYTTTGGGTFQRVIIKSSGRVGIGPNNPQQQFDVQEGAGNPQLRLSYSSTKYADFKTTSTGYLYVDASDNRVGIEQSSPGNTLDVGGGVKVGTVPTSSDGSLNLLVWSGSSDIEKRVLPYQYVVSACSLTPGQNKLAKFGTSTDASICGSQIVDDGVEVGINVAVPTLAKLEIESAAGGNGEYVHSPNIGLTVVGDTKGIVCSSGGGFGMQLTGTGANGTNYGVSSSVSGATTNYGVYGATSGSTTLNVGVYGNAQSSTTNNGLLGYAEGGTTSKGAFATGYNAPTTYGGHFTAQGDGSGGSTAYGIYASASSATNLYAIWSNGDTHVAGNLCHTGSFGTCSDQQFKENVEPLPNALEKINQLQPRTYTFNTTDYDFMNFPDNQRYGFIAQEVENVLPDIVTDETNPNIYDDAGNLIAQTFDYKGLEELEIIPYLVGAIQELSNKVNDLQEQIDGCCGMGLRSSDPNDGNGQSINLVTKNQIQLGNATPNPNGGLTSIPFHLPQSVVKAEMVFTDLLGQEVNRVELGARGFSKIDVTTTNLEDGTYTYTLIADGKVIDTKQMVKGH